VVVVVVKEKAVAEAKEALLERAAEVATKRGVARDQAALGQAALGQAALGQAALDRAMVGTVKQVWGESRYYRLRQ